MMRSRNVAFAAAFLALWGGPAAAQTAASGEAPKTDLGSKPGDLSDKLGATNGVVTPTGNVDPSMPKSAPRIGTMPVVKPGAVAPGTAK